MRNCLPAPRCNAITLLCFNIAGSSVMLLYDCWQQCYGSNRIAPSNVVDATTLLHLLYHCCGSNVVAALTLLRSNLMAAITLLPLRC